MNEIPANETWFDRLTTTVTRRSALKAGLAAAAAFTLPLARPSSAPADSIQVDPCFAGCSSFGHHQFAAAQRTCMSNFSNAGTFLGVGFSTLTGMLFLQAAPGALAHQLLAVRNEQACYDNALVASKVAQYDCIKPACSGFDPKQPGGPCDTCTNNCCVCPDIPNGYICCFYACDDPDHNCCGS